MPGLRYRFGAFLLSPAHRTLRGDDRDVPLIQRYFDLLVLLVSNRHRVVTRQEIFDRVWTDVVVSDGALSQAVRTIRRVLGDDPRDPQFIRTVSRHGYQFVATGVTEEDDDGPLPLGQEPGGLKTAGSVLPGSAGLKTGGSMSLADSMALPDVPADPFQPWLDRLLRHPPYAAATDEERHEAAEQLHALGTHEALRRLDAVPGHAEARAILREARWDVLGAGGVPLVKSQTGRSPIVWMHVFTRGWTHEQVDEGVARLEARGYIAGGELTEGGCGPQPPIEPREPPCRGDARSARAPFLYSVGGAVVPSARDARRGDQDMDGVLPAAPPRDRGCVQREARGMDRVQKIALERRRLAFDQARDVLGPDKLLIVGMTAVVDDDVARARDADHIVVGSRGLNRMRAILGSVSHELLHRASCPVTVIPAAPEDRG